MTLSAFRIVQNHLVSNAFSGEGARLYGGRWNSVGVSMIYAGSTVSLATLEMLVHIDDISTMYGQYSAIALLFDAKLVESLNQEALSSDWNAPQVLPDTQEIGDRWIRQGRSAVLSVPSAVVPDEQNFLLNPLHRDFSKIEIGMAKPLLFDPRLKFR